MEAEIIHIIILKEDCLRSLSLWLLGIQDHDTHDDVIWTSTDDSLPQNQKEGKK